MPGIRHHSATSTSCMARLQEIACQLRSGVQLWCGIGCVLLHMAAVVDKMTPVVCSSIPRLLFTETLEYQQEVSDRLGLRNVQNHSRR